MTDWTQMEPTDFGRPTHHVQTALMLTAADGTALTPDADPMGTLDLFGAEDQDGETTDEKLIREAHDRGYFPGMDSPLLHGQDRDQAAAAGPGQHPDNYVSQLACGHEHDTPEPTTDGQAVTCSAHGPTTVADPAANPRWWENAVAGTCSHGGHGWDGDTCDDAPAAPDQHPDPAAS
jgi:hypothetical protein